MPACHVFAIPAGLKRDFSDDGEERHGLTTAIRASFEAAGTG
jgi:hypothetical protein